MMREVLLPGGEALVAFAKVVVKAERVGKR